MKYVEDSEEVTTILMLVAKNEEFQPLADKLIKYLYSTEQYAE